MILDKKIAKQVDDALIQCSSEINETIRLVQNNCSPEEFEIYRRSAGFIMGSIFIDIREKIYNLHPEIAPEALNE